MNAHVFLPQGMPCVDVLQTSTYSLCDWQGVGECLRVLFLNLMPVKVDTELDIARVLSLCTNRRVQILPMKIKGQTYKTTPMEHMEQLYLDFEHFVPYQFDRLIITGAPLEQMPFEAVRYWPQLQQIMHWADEHVERTLYICWAAQAGLYEHYGINKYALADKMFGIFDQRVLCPDSFLMRGLTPSFKMPNSRHTAVSQIDVEQAHDKGLQLIAASNESGVGVMATLDGRRTFIVGHLEYAADTLDKEYKRDLSKNLPIKAPLHYYNKEGQIAFSWQSDAAKFYRNWLE